MPLFWPVGIVLVILKVHYVCRKLLLTFSAVIVVLLTVIQHHVTRMGDFTEVMRLEAQIYNSKYKFLRVFFNMFQLPQYRRNVGNNSESLNYMH